MNVEYTVQTWREGKQYVAQASRLDVVSAGPTQKRQGKLFGKRFICFLRRPKSMGHWKKF